MTKKAIASKAASKPKAEPKKSKDLSKKASNKIQKKPKATAVKVADAKTKKATSAAKLNHIKKSAIKSATPKSKKVN
jgi:hypothetical protein